MRFIETPGFEKKLVKTLLAKPIRVDAVIISLVIILCLLSGSLIFWETSFSKEMPVSLDALVKGEWPRLFYAMFAHGDVKHFLSNAYMFFIMSLLLNNYFGSLLHPITTFFLGALTNGITVYYSTPGISLIGASGWVYVLAGLWLSLFFLIETRYSKRSRILRVGAVSLVVLFPSTFEANVSYMAHAVGYFVGAAYGVVFFKLKKESFDKEQEFQLIPLDE